MLKRLPANNYCIEPDGILAAIARSSTASDEVRVGDRLKRYCFRTKPSNLPVPRLLFGDDSSTSRHSTAPSPDFPREASKCKECKLQTSVIR